jgi:hypothetical protein
MEGAEEVRWPWLAVAIEDHEAKDKTSLALRRGQLVAIIEEDHETGQYKGQLSKTQSGWFPTYFVKSYEDGTSLVGWLTKQGGIRKNWKKRWFQLNPHKKILTYHVEVGFAPLSCIDLSKVLSVSSVEHTEVLTGASPKYQNIFQLVTPERTWYFNADSEKEKEGWIAAVSAVVMGEDIPSSKKNIREAIRPTLAISNAS